MVPKCSSPNSVVSWGPRVQTQELVGSMSHSNHHMLLCLDSSWNNGWGWRDGWRDGSWSSFRSQHLHHVAHSCLWLQLQGIWHPLLTPQTSPLLHINNKINLKNRNNRLRGQTRAVVWYWDWIGSHCLSGTSSTEVPKKGMGATFSFSFKTLAESYSRWTASCFCVCCRRTVFFPNPLSIQITIYTQCSFQVRQSSF